MADNLFNGADITEVSARLRAALRPPSPLKLLQDRLSTDPEMLAAVRGYYEGGLPAFDTELSVFNRLMTDPVIKDTVKAQNFTAQSVVRSTQRAINAVTKAFAEQNGHDSFTRIASGRLKKTALQITHNPTV